MTSGKYLQYTMEQKESLLKSYGRTLEGLKEDVEAIKLWLEKQPHIPKNNPDIGIEHALIENKFIFKNAKRCIDWYFRIRNIYPDYFKAPYEESVVIASNQFYLYPLPKLTSSNSRVIMSKLKSKVLHPKMDEKSGYALAINMSDFFVNHDCPFRKVIVFDCRNYTIEFCSLASPTALRAMQIIFEKAYHNGIKELHGIYLNPYVETFVNMIIKTFLNPKIAARIRIHKDLNSLYEFVPKEILPKDYGGDELSIDELHELWQEELMKHKPFFDERKFKVTDESLRTEDIPDCDILGVQGNFRKLVVD